jgi:hypothetical protein
MRWYLHVQAGFRAFRLLGGPDKTTVRRIRIQAPLAVTTKGKHSERRIELDGGA